MIEAFPFHFQVSLDQAPLTLPKQLPLTQWPLRTKQRLSGSGRGASYTAVPNHVPPEPSKLERRAAIRQLSQNVPAKNGET